METGFKHDHIALMVADLRRSARFYQALGGEIVSKPSERFVEILLGELRLHLICAEPQNETGRAAARRIDHICLQVTSRRALEAVLNVLNQSESAAVHGPFQIQDSPPLGPDSTHCEQRPPLATLYFRDPDGLGFEARCYHP